MRELFWLDLETTGLDPRRSAVLEACLLRADFRDPFRVETAYETTFRFDRHRDGRRAGIQFGRWYDFDEFVADLHSRNGLFDDCRRSTAYVSDAEERLLEIVPLVADREERPVLAGSTVHFDRGFLREHMPRLEARFAHRHYDASSVKLFCESLGMPRLEKAEAHRARPDVLESVEHARRCAAWLGGAFVLPAC